MEAIPQKELRNDVGAVLRRVEAGESLLVTVAGRPVAQLSPATRRQWVGGDTLTAIWRTSAPHGLEDDLAGLGATLIDPFSR